MHQDLDAGLGLVIAGFDGKALLTRVAPPVVAGDGGQVRVSKKGNERAQNIIVNWEKPCVIESPTCIFPWP